MTESSNKTATVIDNPIKVDLDELTCSVSQEATAAGWVETIWFETSVEDVGQEATGRALEQGADVSRSVRAIDVGNARIESGSLLVRTADSDAAAAA